MNSPFTPYQEALGATLIDRSFREKIVLVAVALPGVDETAVDASLDELELLVDTAGADVVARVVQRRDAPDHTWYIGKGKAEELKQICVAVDADTVVFDNELSPAQQFNLEKLLSRTAIDRTAVILDIFAQNAHTLEGKAQVELALLRYRLPRLRRGRAACRRRGCRRSVPAAANRNARPGRRLLADRARGIARPGHRTGRIGAVRARSAPRSAQRQAVPAAA